MKEIIAKIESINLEIVNDLCDGEGGEKPVELIRCKDCISWKKGTSTLEEYCWCGTLQRLTHYGDYCAWSPNLDEDGE